MKKQKDKSKGFLYCMFFGFFGWLYTYKDDAWKFWIALISLLVAYLTRTPYTFLFMAFYVWGCIDRIAKPELFYKNYYKRLDEKKERSKKILEELEHA